jgi:hypothetical protein
LTGQSRQEPEKSNVETLHWHTEEPMGEMRRGPQEVHVLELNVENVSAGQGSHKKLDPFWRWKNPAWQGMGRQGRPGASVAVPSGQAEHEPDPNPDVLFWGHGVQEGLSEPEAK